MKTKKRKPIHPGEILGEEFLTPMAISQYRLAKDIRVSPRRINEIVHGQRAISADTALRLGRYFSISAQFWINLQSHYDLAMAEDRIGAKLEREVRVWAGTDEDIDYSDLPPLDTATLEGMQIRPPKNNVAATLGVKPDLLDLHKRPEPESSTHVPPRLKRHEATVNEPATVREPASTIYKVEDRPARQLANTEFALGKPSRMTLRKDIGYYVRTRVPMRTGLLDIHLGYGEMEGAPVCSLGRFRLNLPRLLALGHLRYVEGSRKEVVLLLRLNSEGIIGLQTKKDQPFLPLARVPTG